MELNKKSPKTSTKELNILRSKAGIEPKAILTMLEKNNF